MNAAEMQGRLRAGGRSFLGRLRRLGGWVPRGEDAYWADRSDDVDAWLHYHVEQGGGVPTLFITGSCAEFHWPELLDRMEGRVYIATGESVGLREDATRRYQASQDYSLLAQEFSQERLVLYLKEVITPVFGVKHYWYRFEFAKSRGQIHFHLFAICADKQPHKLLHEMEGGESQDAADALAKWAWGTLSLTAMHPADTPDGGLDLPNVRVPDGEWAPPERRQRSCASIQRR